MSGLYEDHLNDPTRAERDNLVAASVPEPRVISQHDADPGIMANLYGDDFCNICGEKIIRMGKRLYVHTLNGRESYYDDNGEHLEVKWW